jgi:hypothetical protein
MSILTQSFILKMCTLGAAVALGYSGCPVAACFCIVAFMMECEP